MSPPWKPNQNKSIKHDLFNKNFDCRTILPSLELQNRFKRRENDELTAVGAAAAVI